MRLLPIFALATLAITGTAQADDTDLKSVWGGGPAGTSAYTDVYVPATIAGLDTLNMTGYHWGGVSQGTLFNAEKVTDHPTNIAVGQADILSSILGKPIAGRTGETYQFTVLQKSLGPECLYLVAPPTKRYTTWGSFLADAWEMNLVTAGEKSGSFGTWKVLQDTYPDALKDIPVKHVADNAAILDGVENVPDTVGFFVMRPDPQSPIFKRIIEAKLTIVPVVDFELEGKYYFNSLKVAYGGLLEGAKYVNTACTSVEMITGDPNNTKLVDPRDRRRVAETIKRVGSAGAELFKPNTSTWRDMWDSITEFTGDKAKDLMEESKQAAAAIIHRQ